MKRSAASNTLLPLRTMKDRPMRISRILLLSTVLCGVANPATAQSLPRLLSDPDVMRAEYLPDFSFAGYGFGNVPLPEPVGRIVDVAEYGAVADDGVDDSRSVLAALAAAHKVKGPVRVRFPAGRFILSEVLMIERDHLVLEGAGQGAGGTELYFPRPLRMVDKSDRLATLRHYLVDNDKRQIEKAANIDEPFSAYSWSGGFIWAKAPGMDAGQEYATTTAQQDATGAVSGALGGFELEVAPGAMFKRGDIVSIRWYSREGKSSGLLRSLFGSHANEAGSRMWESPDRAIVVQTTRIDSIEGNRIRIADPLLHAVGPGLPADVAPWQGLQEVGVRDLAVVFPEGDSFGHHLEEGWNGICLSDVFNGWVNSVRITNADSGILTYNSANLTLRDVLTDGERVAHYSVHMGSVHNALVSGLQVLNPVRHSLSLNTRSTRSVFQRATVWQDPVLDQHAGANHQNLFDNITLFIRPMHKNGVASYPLWDGSGASYWQPGHGRFNTHWNLRVVVLSGALPGERVVLQGLEEGPDARVVGLSGNRPFAVDYRPQPYMEMINQEVLGAPSLYDWQLARRTDQQPGPAKE